MVYSAASGHGFELFSLPLVSEKHGADGNVVPRNESASNISSLLHTVFGYALLFFVSLHVLGALKHHFIYKNEILSRMLSFRKLR
jgi:cytochrome b561